MHSKLLIGGLLASVIIVPALAQSSGSPAPSHGPAATTTAPATTSASMTAGQAWRASKLIGLNVYNDQNEKLGDISELLIDKSGKVEGVVIGVGGFLGLGQHDIKVEVGKLTFVDQPVRTSSSTSSSTTGAGNAPATGATTTTTTSRSSDHKWYPDHAVLSGASKDQLKSMPEFKF